MKPSVFAPESPAIKNPPTTNKHLIRWVEKMAELCRPDSIHWVDGSQAEYDFSASASLMRERLLALIKSAGPDASMLARCRAMLPALKIARSSVHFPVMAPGPPIIGKTHTLCGGG